MSPIQASVALLLEGRDSSDPEDAAIILECTALLVEDRLLAFDPLVLAEAFGNVQAAALEGPPELARIRLAWLAYLRSVVDLDPSMPLEACHPN
jgi:hypothetical protein